MAQRNDYWTHGVATILESPQLATLVVHNGLGTIVEQNANTSGWFHIPISTPAVLDSDTTTSLIAFALSAKVNENAQVDLIHLRRGQDLIFNQNFAFIGTPIKLVLNTPIVSTSVGASSGSGITLCVHVKFLSGDLKGRVELYGAGAAFA